MWDPKQVDDIKTAPMDFRFPTTNQAKHCYTRYNEFHKYVAGRGTSLEFGICLDRFGMYLVCLRISRWVAVR